MANVVNVEERREAGRAHAARGGQVAIQRRNGSETPKMVNGSEGHVPALHTVGSYRVSKVDRTLMAPEADPVAALGKLRDLVVGPSQKLNEARLEELVKIFEEREADLLVAIDALNDRQDRNLKEAKTETAGLLSALRDDLARSAEKLAMDQKAAVAALKDLMAQARLDMETGLDEMRSLLQSSEQRQAQNLEAAQQDNRVQRDAQNAQHQADLNTLKDELLSSILASQRDVLVQISRNLMSAGEQLSKVSERQR